MDINSQFLLFNILLLIIGLMGGTLSGLLGVGGGIIFVPVLSFVFVYYGISSNMSVQLILANSLLIIFFSCLSAVVKQLYENVFRWKLTLLIAIPGVISSVLFTIALNGNYSKKQFSLIFILLMILILLKMIFSKKNTDIVKSNFSNTKLIITGFITGLITSLSGLGGGIIMIPLFNKWLKMEIKQSTSLSIGVIPILVLPILIYYMFQQFSLPSTIIHTGYLCWNISLPLLIGAIIGSPIGVTISKKLNEKTILFIFILFVTFTLFKMIFEL